MLRRSSWFGPGLVVACLAVASMCVTACRNKENERWQGAQEAAERRVDAHKKGLAPAAVSGGSLNKFFPADGESGLRRTFEQEKTGYVQAKYSKDGTDATLSISDLAQNEDARKKFQTASERLGSDPVTTVGKNQTTVLVADRWQVKVSSQQLDHNARKALLQKFDLSSLRGFNP